MLISAFKIIVHILLTGTDLFRGDDNEPIKCKFPSWATEGAFDAQSGSADGQWRSFSRTSEYVFTPDGGRLIVSNYSHLYQVSHQTSLAR